ncbi:hypothetical protein Taro_027989 [Colocasia esculenta]|uniref:Uncharacterized protein n=1 Tax=Colocasia esculenta TaxID=4460 RepID=A0A843VSY4_COLES|nr:hypothetical protein [Colocasia esculenta]
MLPSKPAPAPVVFVRTGMTGVLGKCCRIRHIVRLRQMLRRWRARAACSAAAARAIPADVPAGHVAVCVGSKSRRFVVRAAHLNHPAFRRMLAQAEEEYGFAQPGPLTIPCDEALFEEVLRHLDSSAAGSTRGFPRIEDLQKKASSCRDWHDSLPLLQGFLEKSAAW